ncbi:MAG: hypothetical protein AB1847_06550 [bacterium]
MPEKVKKQKAVIKKKRYYFFLNHYPQYAFTKCPKCENKTKLRKFALVVNIDPGQPVILNVSCRFCPYCDLIIAKQAEVEALLWGAVEKVKPEIVGNAYLVLGTIERADWRNFRKGGHAPVEIIKCISLFKDVLDFKVIPAGWYPADQEK